MNKKDLFGTSLVEEKKQKLILKGLWGLKNKYSPGGIKVKYQHADLNEDIPEEFINPQSQMDYYAWWLDNRRKLLELNMKDTGLYPDLNGREYLRNILNGYLPGRIALNKEIYNQLGRVSDTIYLYDDTYNPILTTNNGQYFKDKDGVPTVVIKKGLDKNKQYYTILHELVHNGNNPEQIISGVYDSNSATSPLEKKIKLIGVNVNKEYDDMIKNLPEYVDMLNYERTYLNTPSEIYARMMEFRKENNLNPNKKYSKEEIKKMIDKSKVSGIKAYDIEKLTKALNEVAQNNNLSKNYNLYAKRGGKMNILEFLKNGSGIHIKEKNKGSFTRWCGGNVTEECIRRGKNSPNPKIRKKATFALNSRRWKHKSGGIIKALEGTRTSWISNSLGKVGNILNSDTGKLAINGITSMIGTAVLNRAIDKQIEANNKMKEVDIQKAKLDKYRKLLSLQDMTPEIDSNGNIINKSSIVALNNAYKQAMESTDTSEILDTYDRVNRLLGNEKYMNLKGMLGDMVDTLSSILGGKKKDNNSSNNSTSSNNSYFGNYVKTLFKNYGTLNSDGSMNLGNGLGTFSTTGGYKPQQYQMKTPLLKFSV